MCFFVAGGNRDQENRRDYRSVSSLRDFQNGALDVSVVFDQQNLVAGLFFAPAKKVLQGVRDYQVTMEDFKRWQSALAGKSNVTFKSYPQLNHLFIAGTNRSTPLEYDEPGHVDERVVDDIASWIKKH